MDRNSNCPCAVGARHCRSCRDSLCINHEHRKFRPFRLYPADVREEDRIKVKVVARGTGAAIETGKRGDADVVFVHAKELELEAVKSGHFVNRSDVMYNDFVVIGPGTTRQRSAA